MVVDWQRPDQTIAALNSLAAMTPPPDLLVCVENGCPPEQVARVRAHAPAGAVLVELPANQGFTGGCNAGVARALDLGADWVLLLNDDATVEPECLAACLQEAGDGVAVVGPAVVFADRPDRLWFAGGRVSHWFAFTRHPGLRRGAGRIPPTGDTGYVAGCCALLSAAAWRRLGGFRDDLFAYYEDAEWCVRARAAGYRCRYVGRVLCRHVAGGWATDAGDPAFNAGSAYYLARNPLRCALDTPSVPLRLTRAAGILVVWNAYNALRMLQSRDAAAGRAYLEGLWDGFRGRMGKRRSSALREGPADRLPLGG